MVRKATLPLALVNALVTSNLSSATATFLGGPDPNGWETSATSDFAKEASLAIDLGLLYESEKSEQMDLFFSGRGESQSLTLFRLSERANVKSGHDPLFCFYWDCFAEIGEFFNNTVGYFDGSQDYEYANTLVLDLFDTEETPSGIENEAINIFSVWMRFHNHIHEVSRLCSGIEPDKIKMIELLDKAAALWIGNLQLYGDNTRGTMMYNLAERAGALFSQDYSEAVVNTKILSLMTQMKTAIEDDQCTGNTSENKGYDKIYESVAKITGQMNIPLIQNYFHYIETAADPKFIELYTLSLLPQIRACDPSSISVFMDFIGKLVGGTHTTEDVTIMKRLVENMFDCLGVSCDEVGGYMGKEPCDDNVRHNVLASIGGYLPTNNVKEYAKIDRDIFQFRLLLERDNFAGARELYIKGRNGAISLQNTAQFNLREEEENDRKRIYNMFERYYGSTKYADDVLLGSLAEDFQRIISSRLLQVLIAPHFALKSYFAAFDQCTNNNHTQASLQWDQGTAVILGSMETINFGNSQSNGHSWFALSKEYCPAFGRCEDDLDTGIASVNNLMMTQIESGRNALMRHDCTPLHQHIRTMESLTLIPLLQGVLFHAAQRENGGDERDFHYASAQAFGTALLPVLDVASKSIAEEVKNNLFTPDDDYSGARSLWSAIALVLPRLAIRCEEIGFDSLGLMGGESFCDFVSMVTEFPTAAPNTIETEIPTAVPTISPTAEIASIDPEIIRDYTFSSDLDANTKAKIALDLRDISLLSGHLDGELFRAVEVYEKGIHSSESIKTLSIDTRQELTGDAIYNFYRSALRDIHIVEDNGDSTQPQNPVDIYAHSIIFAAFNSKETSLASEAILILTIWLRVAHNISAATKNCQLGEISKAVSNLDSALAYYVGVGQTKSLTDGYLLYSLAQRAAEIFHSENFNFEAKANSQIITFFNEARVLVDSCDGEYSPFLALKAKNDSILRSMNIPLVQMFVNSLHQSKRNDEKSNYMELYALAVLPQIETCQPSMYTYLSKQIILNELDINEIDMLIDAFRSTYYCFGITCNDVHGDQSDQCGEASNSLAGFTPFEEVTKDARIDIDILKLKTLVIEGALDSALDHYMYGSMLSPVNDSFQSLQLMARSSSQMKPKPPFLKLFEDYYGDSAYVDTIILSALSESPSDDFLGLTLPDKAVIIQRSLQTMVLFSTALGSMFEAGDTCSYQKWDRAAALLIGSIEGDNWGGDNGNNGVTMYSLSKETCAFFDTCTNSDSAELNDDLFRFLSTGEDYISGGNCDDISSLVETEVIPLLLVPLIQGIVANSVESMKDESKADRFVLARAILPFVYASNTTSAETIDSLTQLNSSDVSSTLMLDAFSGAINQMGVSCSDLGFSMTLEKGFCLTEYDPNDSSDLSNGLYITSTFVDERAKIALDLSDIVTELKRGSDSSKEIAKLIYLDGRNSHIIDKNGRKTGERSLAYFSLKSNVDMMPEPVFNLYRYALQDSVGDSEVNTYAHNLVMSFFDDVNDSTPISDRTLPAEAAVAMNLWSYIIHKVQTAVNLCSTGGSLVGADGVHLLDEVAAYWIGSEQETGDWNKGHSLYNLAEKSGKEFGQVGLDQSRVNRNVLKLLKEASMQVAFENGCSVNPFVASNLRQVVHKIVSQMTVPLIQHLIWNLISNDRGRVKIYSHALIPLVAGCKQSTYTYLKEKLLSPSYQYHISETKDIIEKIQDAYSCLGLSCNDIGDLITSEVLCVDRDNHQAMAGYKPTSDVREFSDLDLDIRYMEVLMEMKAYDAANDVYTHGKHASIRLNNREEMLSLRSLAVSTGREKVPSFKLFERYFSKSQMNYADNLINDVFIGPPGLSSNEQKTALVINALQYEVLFMAALQKMYETIEGCKSSNEIRLLSAKQQWDEAAAFLIGSMEGYQAEGSHDGFLLHNLARKMCHHFNTCNEYGNAIVNEEIESLLYAGSFSLNSQSCDALKDFVSKIEAHLLVPLIQASLYASERNSKLTTRTTDPMLASGYIFSRSILPYIDDVDSTSAALINKNLAFQFVTEPVVDGVESVYNAFEQALSIMPLTGCKEIGRSSWGNRGLCPANKSSANYQGWISVSIVLSLVCTIIVSIQ